MVTISLSNRDYDDLLVVLKHLGKSYSVDVKQANARRKAIKLLNRISNVNKLSNNL